jgi:predicted amidohydrolase YtcJ
MKADKLFFDGNILTMNQKNAEEECLAIKDGEIIFVGSGQEGEKYKDSKTEVVDLKGRSLIPGFIDAHLHMGVLGMNCSAIDCRYPYVKSIEDIKKKIRIRAEAVAPRTWIRGWGYDHSKLKEGRHPNKLDLDQVAPDNPVMLTRTCAHTSTFNSRGLEVAKVNRDTPEIEGGVIERDEEGNPLGVMKENAHMFMMKVAMPTEEELMQAFRLANDILIREGITSVHDSGGYGQMQMAVQRKAVEQGVIDIRINAMVFSFIENLEFVEEYIKKEPDTKKDPHFRVGPIKLMIDGSSSGPTAATLEPYTSNPHFSGILSMDPEMVEDIVLRAHQRGHQVTTHAVGDRAVDVISSTIEKAIEAYPRKDHRHRIEHCAIVNDALLDRIERTKILPVPQPIFLYEFGDGYIRNYGEDRTNRMFTCKSFIDRGILAAGSSDCPITFSNPLMGIHLAVNRVTQSGAKISQKERIPKMEALRMFTYNGAYASFEEDLKGSLEVGKVADMVVLSEDFTKCSDDRIKDIKVDMTIIDGKIVYERKYHEKEK